MTFRATLKPQVRKVREWGYSPTRTTTPLEVVRGGGGEKVARCGCGRGAPDEPEIRNAARYACAREKTPHRLPRPRTSLTHAREEIPPISASLTPVSDGFGSASIGTVMSGHPEASRNSINGPYRSARLRNSLIVHFSTSRELQKARDNGDYVKSVLLPWEGLAAQSRFKRISNRASTPFMAASKLTKARKERILAKLSQGASVTDVCSAEQVGRRTYYDWLQRDRKWAEEVQLAIDLGNDRLADECLQIADDSENDFTIRERKDGSTYVDVDHEVVRRAELRINTRLKLLALRDPDRFGKRLNVADKSAPDRAEMLRQARERVEKMGDVTKFARLASMIDADRKIIAEAERENSSPSEEESAGEDDWVSRLPRTEQHIPASVQPNLTPPPPPPPSAHDEMNERLKGVGQAPQRRKVSH